MLSLYMHVYICSLPPADNTQTHGIVLKLWSPLVCREWRESTTWNPAYMQIIIFLYQVYLQIHLQIFCAFKYAGIYTYIYIYFFFTSIFVGILINGFRLVVWSWGKGLAILTCFFLLFLLKY